MSVSFACGRSRSPTGWWRSSGCRSTAGAATVRPEPQVETEASAPISRSLSDGRVSSGRMSCLAASVRFVLEELRITGLGVIEDATLPLGPGLTVITGETGAGKTMVVTSLGLLFGGRADAGRVRAAPGRATVDGRLGLPDHVRAAVQSRVVDAGADVDDDGTVLLSRTVTVEGRSRAHVGGRSVPLSVLSDIGEHVLAVHGQSDQLRLLRPAEQR